jgi:F0F1-type ATP synthase membrane subunit b/b'
MTGIPFLQVFLLINVFVIGALSATGIRHAWAHFHPPVPLKPEKPTVQPLRLTPEAKAILIAKAQADFRRVLEQASTELQTDLQSTGGALSKQLEKIGGDVVAIETERYTTMLEQLRKQTETIIVAAQSEIKDHQTDLKLKLSDNVNAEQQRLIAQLDTKLGDAVSSFLTEILQHNVDLGAQMPYMIASLEEHKAEIIKGITGEE